MNSWWVGTISTVIGALTGALLQAWRERTTYRRQMTVRWDQALLTGLADYLATADRALRALQRWRHQRDQIDDELPKISAAATQAFEAVHEKSHIIALLSGDRDHPIRFEARRMRETLLPLCQEINGTDRLDDEQVRELTIAHRRARNSLIRNIQVRLNRDV